ncbi:7575_t:CDS:2 [Dentiscutata erythropus]|uniref:7575_t:CDS:1 n=1 Tax=Dentiscutata erythropus TaxID=1348616 RepID=A0A9N9C3M4_9GLOM|nr:7575_t:CDS:2 [Dentiscutata erythropus]
MKCLQFQNFLVLIVLFISTFTTHLSAIPTEKREAKLASSYDFNYFLISSSYKKENPVVPMRLSVEKDVVNLVLTASMGVIALTRNLHQYSGDDSASAKKLQSIYGDMWETYKGPIRTVWLARNDLFEKIFSPSTNNAFLIRALSNSGLEEFNTTKIGMTFNNDLKEWSYNRKFMSKAIMSPNFIKQVVEGTQDIFEVMEKCWQSLWENLGNDQIFDIHNWILLATSESIILLTTHKRAYSIIDYYNNLLPTKKFDTPIGALEESENYIASIRTYIRAMEFFFTTPKIIRILPGVRRYAQNLIKNRDLLIFPSAPTTFRTSTKPVEIGGYIFPENLQFFIYIEGANNHPQHWTDPDTFNPDRFLDDSNKVINTFGGGLRMCPGRNLSIIEILSFIVMLYRKYDIELVDMNAPIKYNFNIIRQCVKMEARIIPRKFE